MLKDQKELLSAFNKHEVEYLVIGGHAVSEHSQPRATKDLDVFIRADAKNGEAVYRALADYGVPLSGVTPDDFIDKSDTIFQIGIEPNRIDILQSISGVTFDQAWKHRVESVIDGTVPAHFISREDLIENKLASGRYRDLGDVEALREAAVAQSVTPVTAPQTPAQPSAADRKMSTLENALPAELAGQFQWTGENGTVQSYRHLASGDYLYIDAPTGQFYDRDTNPITREAALKRVLPNQPEPGDSL